MLKPPASILLCVLFPFFAANGAISLQITEIWFGQVGAGDVTEDWFEITNAGDTPWVSGVHGDLYYDDESQDPAVADLINDLVDIQPGESVVVVTGIASDAVAFTNVWSPVIDLSGVEVGWTDGSGLSDQGDGVTLWIGDPNSSSPVAYEAYPDGTANSGQSYDVVNAGFSVAGENGAVATLATGGVPSVPAVGSPGVVPEPSTALLAALSMLGLLRRRRA